MVDDDLYSAMSRAGFDPPDHFTPGQFHRFPRNGNPRDKAGWLLAFPDGQGAIFGCWRTGEEHSWQKNRERPLSESEKAAHRALVEMAKRQAREARERAQADAAEKAREMWAKAGPAPADHAYLIAKGITPEGTRIGTDGRLLVPVHGPDGIMSIQFIAPDGTKRFLADGKTKGGQNVMAAR